MSDEILEFLTGCALAAICIAVALAAAFSLGGHA